MRKLLFEVEDRICDECALALRRFIGPMAGIESIDVEAKKIVIVFDDAKVPEEKLLQLATDSLEKLGHAPAEHLHVV